MLLISFGEAAVSWVFCKVSSYHSSNDETVLRPVKAHSYFILNEKKTGMALVKKYVTGKWTNYMFLSKKYG